MKGKNQEPSLLKHRLRHHTSAYRYSEWHPDVGARVRRPLDESSDDAKPARSQEREKQCVGHQKKRAEEKDDAG